MAPLGDHAVAFPWQVGGAKRLSGNVRWLPERRLRTGGSNGRFASQTYGGGLRFQITTRQDVVNGFGSYQETTQDRRDAASGSDMNPFIGEKCWRLGPSGIVVKPLSRHVADGLMLAAFCLRRDLPQNRYFARRDARVTNCAKSGTPTHLRSDSLRAVGREERRSTEGSRGQSPGCVRCAGPGASARLRNLEDQRVNQKRIFESPAPHGWRRMRSLGSPEDTAPRKEFLHWPRAFATPDWRHGRRPERACKGAVPKRRRRFWPG